MDRSASFRKAVCMMHPICLDVTPTVLDPIIRKSVRTHFYPIAVYKITHVRAIEPLESRPSTENDNVDNHSNNIPRHLALGLSARFQFVPSTRLKYTTAGVDQFPETLFDRPDTSKINAARHALRRTLSLPIIPGEETLNIGCFAETFRSRPSTGAGD